MKKRRGIPYAPIQLMAESLQTNEDEQVVLGDWQAGLEDVRLGLSHR